MSLVKRTFIALLLLGAAELALFVAAVAVFGWLPILAFGLATTLAGMVLLKQSGRRDLQQFRTVLANRDIHVVPLDGQQLVYVISGILLLFPGFITDLAAVLWLLSPVRRLAGAALRNFLRNHVPSGSGGDAVVDLTPDQWHQVQEPPLEDRRHRPDRP